MTIDDPLPDSGMSAKLTVAIQTVGCKLNQSESEVLARRFVDAGFKLVTSRESPDVYILNTCTVTHIADRKCRQYLRSFQKKNPQALIIAVGCYAERDANAVKVDGVGIVAGNKEKDRLVELVKTQLKAEPISIEGNGHQPFVGSFRTRAMVKVQEGCSHGCSYCIVPSVRGSERSVQLEAIISEISSREMESYKEVVLTGTRIGKWQDGLEYLVQRILEETSILRIRLSSLQPGELSSSFVELWKSDERICRHLHMALQSGCGTTLKRMDREYSIDEYERAVDMIRQSMPDIAVTTDIIVGFPGETDDEFEESRDFCRRISFADMHVFPYSIRTGTVAANFPGRIPDGIKKSRSLRMIELAKQGSQDFHQKFKGKVMPVLWEECRKGNLWIGHTSNYMKVFATSDETLNNCLLNTKLGDEYEQGILGEICESSKLAKTVAKGV